MKPDDREDEKYLAATIRNFFCCSVTYKSFFDVDFDCYSLVLCCSDWV